MNGLYLVLYVAAGACVFSWIASLLSGDTSWVDRLWSIVPVAYLWIFAGAAHFHDARLNVMAVLVTIWGARLTFNFARKGGYSGVEDYRWEVLRSVMNTWQFQLFNFFFIVLYQHGLLVLITLPTYTAAVHRRHGFGAWDYALTVLFLLLTLGETVADQQQWNFHQRKKRGTHGELPFLTTGLFRVSRHPNYFFEIAQWWVVYLFAVSATRCWWNWTLIGPVLLTLLFVGSTRFTESISLGKYPAYAGYQRRVWPIIPWFPKRQRR